MAITSTASADSKEITIQVSGRFDFSTHQDFMRAYKEHPRGEKRFVVDLTQAEYMDSSAMGMLLQLREHSNKENGGVVLKGGSGAIQEILRIANFGKIFTIE